MVTERAGISGVDDEAFDTASFSIDAWEFWGAVAEIVVDYLMFARRMCRR